VTGNQTTLFEPVAHAIFSPCTKHDRPCPEACVSRLYRYRLYWPTGIQSDSSVLWVLANPSTASSTDTDPTIRRCIGYTRAWGYGWAAIANVRAWRETDPDLVPRDATAIGPDNDSHITAMAQAAEFVVCGWGALGGERGSFVLDLLRGLGKLPHALKLTKDGAPGHPLYLSASLKPFPMVQS
jgi:hypothetical protein